MAKFEGAYVGFVCSKEREQKMDVNLKKMKTRWCRWKLEFIIFRVGFRSLRINICVMIKFGMQLALTDIYDIFKLLHSVMFVAFEVYFVIFWVAVFVRRV